MRIPEDAFDIRAGLDGEALGKRRRCMSGARIVAVVGIAWACGLIALIVVSSLEMSLGAGLRDIVGTRWGITTLVDLYAGLAFVGAWIACLERSWKRATLWAVALGLTGNLATAVYVAARALRARSVREVFMGRSEA
jgi:hypothetical protein